MEQRLESQEGLQARAPSGYHLQCKLDLVLVVEDEYHIADDMERALVGFGCQVEIVPDLLSAMGALQQQRPDAAVLDLNLKGEMAFLVADTLLRKGVPFLFMTGHEPHVIPRRFSRIVRCEKPIAPQQVVSALFHTAQRHARSSNQLIA